MSARRTEFGRSCATPGGSIARLPVEDAPRHGGARSVAHRLLGVAAVAVGGFQTSFPERSIERDALRLLRHRAWEARPHDALLAEQAWRAAGGDLEVAFAAIGELCARYRRVTDAPRSRGVDRLGWFDIDGHSVWIGPAERVDASCSCRDYRAASLGLCEHILGVLVHGGGARQAGIPAVRWDPLRPLSGPDRWLGRIWWDRVAARRLGLPAPTTDAAITFELVRAMAQLDGVVEPAVRALVERERAHPPPLAAEAIDAELATLAVPLFAFQRAGVHRFLATGRLLLADDMGLGKTAQAIACAHVLAGLGRAARILVIAPSPLKWQWVREWERFTGMRPRLVDGSAARRCRTYGEGDGVYVVSYEQARRDVAALAALAPELVILDEAQRIKNANTVTARAVKQLMPPWRLALTGTPLENRVQELASVVAWLDDLALEPVWRLDPCHAMRDEHHQICGVRELSTLRDRIAHVFLRRVRAEVIRQLPSRRDIEVPVAMSTGQHVAHDDLRRPIARYASILQRRALARDEHLALMRLLTQQRIICSGLALHTFAALWPELQHAAPSAELLESLSSPKLTALAELVRALVIDQGRKVVVFSQWRRMLQLAEWVTRPLLADAGVQGAYFSGEEASARRIANLDRFHVDPCVRVLWSTDAGAVGLNLQRAASCCINLELPWNPAVREQRVARIHRVGQPEPVEVYDLVAIAGIERRIAGLLDTKQALFSELFDGDRDEIDFSAVTGRAGGILALVKEDA